MAGEVLHQDPAGGLELRAVHPEAGQPDPERILLVVLVDRLGLNALLVDGLLAHHPAEDREGVQLLRVGGFREAPEGDLLRRDGQAVDRFAVFCLEVADRL